MVEIKTVYYFVHSNRRGGEFWRRKKEQESFGSCSAWEGANDLPWGRNGLPGGPGVGGNNAN